MGEDQRVGDDRIYRTLVTGTLRLAHAIANDLAAAELHLLAIGREVLLHLDHEVGIRETHFVADGWTKHLRVGCAGHTVRHFFYLNIQCSRGRSPITA